MAYVNCVRCGLPAFTVAYWSSVEYCARCGAQLPPPVHGVRPVISRRSFPSGLGPSGDPERDAAIGSPQEAPSRELSGDASPARSSPSRGTP